MIVFVCLVILVIVLAWQDIGSDKFHVASVFFWIYVGNILFSISPWGEYLEANNYYVLQSLYSLVIILILMFYISKLSLLIMFLEFVTIASHGLGYWVDLQYDQEGLYKGLILVIFGVEVAAIISSRLVDGIYRGFRELSLLCGSFGLLNKSDTSRDQGS